MGWSEDERAQLRTEYFLRFLTLKLPADSSALVEPRHEASLLVHARTELWPAASLDHVDRLWHYKRARLLAGSIERHADVAVVPLFDSSSPHLHALLAVCGLALDYTPSEEHRDLFARLLGEARASGRPRTLPVAPASTCVAALSGPRDGLDEAQRERIEDALASTRGNVTAAARLLRVPLRTFKDRIRRFDVDVAAFRVRPT